MAKIFTWYIVIEEKGVVGNPIKIHGTLNDLEISVTDANGNKLNVVGVFKSKELARKIAVTNKDRSIYAWKENSKEAWYRSGRK